MPPKVFHFIVDTTTSSSVPNSNTVGVLDLVLMFIPTIPTNAEVAGGVIGATIVSAMADEDIKRIRFAKGSSYDETLRSLVSFK